MTAILTRKGMRAVFNAEKDGLQATISHIAYGDGAYTPAGTEDALQNEIVRIPIAGGEWVDDYMIHITALLDTGPDFWVREAGIMLDDGTLLAVWSDPDTPMLYRTAGADFITAFDLALEVLPKEAITFQAGDVDLSLFLAPEFATLATAIITSMRMIADLQIRIANAEREIARLSDSATSQADAITRLS